MRLHAFLPSIPFFLQSLPSSNRMIKAITSCDPLDPSATKWTPRRTVTDPLPRTYVSVKDCLPPDRINGNRRRRRRKIIAPPQNSAAAHNDTLPAGPPPQVVEQTSKSSPYITATPHNVKNTAEPSPSTIVEQATPPLMNIATTPHHLPSTKAIAPAASLRCFVPTPPIVEHRHPLLPLDSVEKM